MPLFQAMSARANELLRRDRIREIDPALVEGRSLVEVAGRLGIVTNEAEAAYLDAWPSVLRSLLLTVVARAVEERQPVTISWAPGYDYEVTVWEAADTDVSPGGLTVLLRSRYPGHNPVQGM